MKVQVKQLSGSREGLKLIRQWPQRLEKMQAQYAYLGAKYMHDQVTQRIPKGTAYRGYRQGLEVVKVKGTSKGEYSYAVQIDKTNRHVKEMSPHRQLIWVKQGSRMGRRADAIELLVKGSPWTFESLPFKPKRSEARLVTHKATAEEVMRVTRKKQRERQRYAPKLAHHGVRVPGRANSFRVPNKMAKLPDAALDALKLEFGLGGVQANPAWRVGFRGLKKKGFSGFLKDKRFFGNPLTKSSYNQWKKWPPPTKHKISVGQAKAFKGFQDKVALRGG